MHRIIIDTEDYSGNFERQMVAFATGCFDEEGGFARDIATDARAEMVHHQWWAQNVVPQIHPENEYFGATFVANIWPNPNWVNDGVGNHLRAASEEAMALPRKYPAYNSVAIVVRELPPSDVWEEFQNRVIDYCEWGYEKYKFSSYGQPTLTLEGVRREPVEPAPTPAPKMKY